MSELNSAVQRWEWRFEHDALADPDLISGLALSLCDSFYIDFPNPSLQLLFTEVITNAIDHGVLKLDSTLKDSEPGFDLYLKRREEQLAQLQHGWINISAESLSNGRIQIAVSDSGSGFDYHNICNSSEPDLRLYGRGLLIIKSLCCSVTHIGDGSCIVFEFDVNSAKNNLLAGSVVKPVFA